MKIVNKGLTISFLGILLGIIHSCYIYKLFENDRHFSHLSDMERELSFRSEMGLYFSYYKAIVNSKNVLQGIYSIMNDNLTEFPTTINTLQRFNLYPEVGAAILYRVFNYTTKNYFKLNLVECWWISRGQYPSVKSCVGFGDPTYFYVLVVTLFAGITVASLFFLGYILSNSVFGGLIAVSQFFFNHMEATRVMWTIPLRESFGYPIIIFQTFLITCILKKGSQSRHGKSMDPNAGLPSKFLFVTTTCATLSSILTWQFGPFVLFTQIVSINLLHFTMGERGIPRRLLKRITLVHLIALGLSWILLFRNQFLLTSLYASSLLATLICSLSLTSHISQVKKGVNDSGIGKKILTCLLYCVTTIVIKVCLGKLLRNQDDNHIFEILLSKFTSYRNFHTMLYTCSPEFDFLGKQTYQNLAVTLLLPLNAIVLLLYGMKLLISYAARWTTITCLLKGKESDPKTKVGHLGVTDERGSGDRLDAEMDAASRKREQSLTYSDSTITPIPAEVCFTLAQALVFSCLAILIMRLKLLATPHLCIVAALIAKDDLYEPILRAYSKLFGSSKNHRHSRTYSAIYPRIRTCALIGLLAATSYKGSDNLRMEHSHMGEYMNMEQEDMMNWILENTEPWEAFAGPMPIMANIKLSTMRPIVNHPHYEDANLRAITKRVYSLFSRKPQREVHAALTNLSATYAVVEDNWCFYQRSDECKLPSIWDLEDVVNRKRKPVCTYLRRPAYKSKYFTSVYRNAECSILRVNKLGPRVKRDHSPN